MVKLGREEPVASMDASGKIIWTKHNEVQTVNVKSLGDIEEVGHEQREFSASLPYMVHFRYCRLDGSTIVL